MRKNIPHTLPNGAIIWETRPVAVTGIVMKFTGVNKSPVVLVNKRGPECPDFIGCWNLPTGYLEWDESGEEAISREIKEETSISISTKFLRLYETVTDPSINKQSVVLRYDIIPTMNSFLYPSEPHIEEVDKREVSEIKWMPLEEVPKHTWAFDHDTLIFKYFIDNAFRFTK